MRAILAGLALALFAGNALAWGLQTHGFARSAGERRAAQALRWRVFAEELGAKLHSHEPSIDKERFDAYCEHLVVREDPSGEVVGTYRVLGPEAAQHIGCY